MSEISTASGPFVALRAKNGTEINQLRAAPKIAKYPAAGSPEHVERQAKMRTSAMLICNVLGIVRVAHNAQHKIGKYLAAAG